MTWSPEELVKQLRYPALIGPRTSANLMRDAANMIERLGDGAGRLALELDEAYAVHVENANKQADHFKSEADRLRKILRADERWADSAGDKAHIEELRAELAECREALLTSGRETKIAEAAIARVRELCDAYAIDEWRFGVPVVDLRDAIEGNQP